MNTLYLKLYIAGPVISLFIRSVSRGPGSALSAGCHHQEGNNDLKQKWASEICIIYSVKTNWAQTLRRAPPPPLEPLKKMLCGIGLIDIGIELIYAYSGIIWRCTFLCSCGQWTARREECHLSGNSWRSWAPRMERSCWTWKQMRRWRRTLS